MNSTFTEKIKTVASEKKEKPEQFQNLFRYAKDAILIFEAESETILDVNDKACEMYGFAFEDFIGSSLKSISRNVGLSKRQHRKLLETGALREFETVHFRADGTPLYLLVTADIVEYKGQTAVLSINLDVTERKQFEQVLRQRERHLLSVANSTQDAVISADNDGNIIFWNEGARRIFGYEAKEIMGKSARILTPERFRGKFAEEMRRNAATGKMRLAGKLVERQGFKKDGSEIPLELSLGFWETDGDNFFTCVVRDISERRKIERTQKLRAREADLRREVGLIFTGTENSLKTNLKHCAESIANNLDAAFAEIWTFNEEENFLELQGGAGTHKRIDGAHKRIDGTLTRLAVGQFKIGLIAQDRKPYFTNDLLTDQNVRNPEWARQNELVSFAGYPLITSDRLIGVAAIFARHELAQETLDAMASISDIITQSIERRRAEDALEKAIKRERALVEKALDVICTIDAEGRFETINPACFKIWGYQPEELIGRLSLDFVAPEDVARTKQAFLNVVSGANPTNFVNRYRHKNGTLVDTMWTSYWSKDDQSLFAVAHNITERKRIEDRLRRSEANLAAAQRITRLGSWEIELSDFRQIKNNKVYWSDEVYRIFGYEPGQVEVSVNSYFESVQSADRKLVRRSFLEAVGYQKKLNIEYRVVLPDGSERFQQAQGELIFDEQTRQPLRFVGTVQDITEWRQAETLLQKNLSLLTSTFEATADGILVVNLNNQIQTFNEKFVQMWRIPKDAAQKKDTAQISAFISAQLKDAEMVRKLFEKAANEPEIRQFDILELNDGRFYERFSLPQMLDGRVVGRVLSYRDITERERAEKELQESENKLRTLLANMNEGLLQVDENDFIIFVNDSFCQIVGYSQEELIGREWSELLLDSHSTAIINEVNKRRRRGISDKYELCLKNKSGEMRYLMVGGVPVHDAKGAVCGSMGVFTDITDRKRVEKQLLHDAFHDVLTGLANRALFIDHLRMTIERGKSRHSNSYAVLFLDFDRFKVINDSLGHLEGDQLLRSIAQRLEAATRTGDLVARLGGDEFVVLLSELVEDNEAVMVAERIQASLKNPFDLNGNEVFISASIGIALSSSGHKLPEDMLRDADIAMYRAKTKGKAQYQIFDKAMHEHATNQLRIETELRRALDNKDFLLHYQPIFNLETEDLVGFEALVRWKHPERGMIPPFEFIPAAEENGLILPLGAWILEESCRQLRLWQMNNPSAANLSVSVNLSTKQFSQPDLAEQVSAALAATGLAPRCLKLEITESHIMENSETAVKMMHKLRDIGVELSLDDFGTGYSSLSYLPRLPVDYLKIDRSFVIRMIDSRENSEIVRTIIKLARNLKMRVVAEGIETAEQLAHLRNLKCDFAQGYFFAKPLESVEAEQFIWKHRDSEQETDFPPIAAEFSM